ncbi:MAG: JAB domain-containing protein [Bacteroidota bacterium]
MSSRENSQLHLFDRLPCYTTRLVCEREYPYPPRVQVNGPCDAFPILREYYRGRDREEFVTLFLNTAAIITGFSVVSVGGLAVSVVEPRQVFKGAILANAASIVCAHNHPSGNPEPSREDVRVTQQLVEAGKLMGIPVHDHLIVTDRAFTSLSQRGLM